MLVIKAYIEMYKGIRNMPIYSGYKPFFKFIDEMRTLGTIGSYPLR